MSYKTTDGLMRHLRSNGISISGSKEKRQLINEGYYHGYKGYRFFQKSSKRIPFSTYAEVNATIQYDTKLKTLLYPKMMFLETALKSVTLICILEKTGSENIDDMCSRVVDSYNTAPVGTDEKLKREWQKRKLSLQSMIQNALGKAYKRGNPKITHFYENMGYKGVPVWALFEILTMGDFGYLLSCLNRDTREAVSKSIGLNLSADTNRQLVYEYVYALKDLRNAIAHNDVVFDARFKKSDPTKPMKQCLKNETKLSYINFKTIGDYVILICYYLRMLKVSKKEILAFIREFEKITNEYRASVNPAVASMVIHPDLSSRMTALKNFLT